MLEASKCGYRLGERLKLVTFYKTINVIGPLARFLPGKCRNFCKNQFVGMLMIRAVFFIKSI